MKSKKRLFHAIALLAALILSLPGTVQAQKQGLVSMHMEPVIIEAVPAKKLAATLKKHTRLEVSPDLEEATPIQFFYGIGKGKEVAGPFASDRVVAREGKLLPKRGRAIASPWEAFEEPIFGFEDPLVGFEDPLLGFGDPRMVVNHEEQYSSPAEALRAIWGNGGTFGKSDDYGLVIFAMNVQDKRAPVLHHALLVPFRVVDSSGVGERQK